MHHHVYRHMVDYSPLLIWANSLRLISIAFLPFPTELISTQHGRGPPGVGLYIGTMRVASLTNLAAQWIIAGRPDLSSAAAGERSVESTVIATLGMAVAFVVAVTVASIELWALLLLFPAGYLDHRRGQRRERRRASQE